jgi:arylsulfatase A-like enzyme
MEIIKERYYLYSNRVILGLVAGLAASCNSGKVDNKDTLARPNLVFVFADQWRAQATGYAGDINAITPNLDRLAGESVVFKTCISTCPVSSPYRASLLTGMYPLSHGIFYNDKHLADTLVTIAEIYREYGYSTGYIGKWHLNGHPRGEDRSRYRALPVQKENRQGFDYWKVMECTHNYNNSEFYDEDNIKHTWQGYDAAMQTDSAVAYIERNKGHPFILFLSWGPPHDPYQTAPDEFRKLYGEREKLHLRSNIPDSLSGEAIKDLEGYYAHIAALDTYIGKLQAAIQNAGIEKNTIFVFTSDHGDMLKSHAQDRKQKPWDESILVPFILKYPAGLKEPGIVSAPFVTEDIMPTLLGLSNINIPQQVEGEDFSGYLLGKAGAPSACGLIMCPVPFHQWSRELGGREYRGIRTERYTYVRDLNGPWLLFDNDNDPLQMKNLINLPGYAGLQKDMESELSEMLKRTHDDFREADYYMNKWGYDYD